MNKATARKIRITMNNCFNVYSKLKVILKDGRTIEGYFCKSDKKSVIISDTKGQFLKVPTKIYLCKEINYSLTNPRPDIEPIDFNEIKEIWCDNKKYDVEIGF
jgi:hypothetical protein